MSSKIFPLMRAGRTKFTTADGRTFDIFSTELSNDDMEEVRNAVVFASNSQRPLVEALGETSNQLSTLDLEGRLRGCSNERRNLVSAAVCSARAILEIVKP
jgi:hypothetical protein